MVGLLVAVKKSTKLAVKTMFRILFYDLPIARVKNIDAGLLLENWSFLNLDGVT